MALDKYTQLSDEYVEGMSVPATEYDALVRILNAQVDGALEAIGSGIISGFQVTAGPGLAVTITEGKAVNTTQFGSVFIKHTNPSMLSLSSGAPAWIWIAAAFPPDNPPEYDSRETAYAVIVSRPDSTVVPDAQLLAAVTNDGAVVTVSDMRTMISSGGLATDIETRVAALEAAVGIPYGLSASLQSLVAGLMAGGGGGGETTYLETEPYSPADPTTGGQIVTDLRNRLTALEAGGTGGTGLLAVPWDELAEVAAQTLMAVVQQVDWAAADTQPGITYVPGRFGDGSNGTPDFRAL